MQSMKKHPSITLALFAGCCAALAQPNPKSWSMVAASPTTIKTAGEISNAGVTINLESFSALCLEPSATASFNVLGPQTRALTKSSNRHHVVFDETKPALTANPNKEPFYTRAEGAISAFAWVDGKFSNLLLSGEVNTDGGPGGKGAFSRQGLMARWDQGNNFYWFYIDFSNGHYGILRSRFFGVMEDLPGSGGTVKGFRSTKSYFLEFELKGDTATGRIYEETASGQKGALASQTPAVKDAEPFLTGINGYLAEISMANPFKPLHASFGQLSAVEQ
jgi:hypothetical protein